MCDPPTPQLHDPLVEAGRLLSEEKCHDARLVLLDLVGQSPDSLAARAQLENANSSIMPGWHVAMLNDSVRNSGFRDALRNYFSAHPEHTLVDVGAGTGLLSLYAAQAIRTHRTAAGNRRERSSRQITACEANRVMSAIAEGVVEECGLTDLIQVEPVLSVDLERRRFDAMVTETFDAGLLGEHCLDIYHHAWRELLHKRSKVLPCAARMHFFLCEKESIRQSTLFDKPRLGDLELDGVTLLSTALDDEPYDCDELTDFKRLNGDTEIVSIDFSDREQIATLRSGRRFDLSCRVDAASGNVDAVVVWFELQLDESTFLSTRPEDGGCRWQQAIFPVKEDLKVCRGESVIVTFEIKQHLSLLSCGKESEKDNLGKGQCQVVSKPGVSVPRDLLAKAHDRNLLVRYSKIAECLSDKAGLRILDCDGFGGLLTLHILRAAPSASAGFLFDAPDSIPAKTEFLFGIGEQNGLLRPTERLHAEFPASLDDTGDFGYDALVWDPVCQGGMLEVVGPIRQCLTKAVDKSNRCRIFPASVTVYCRLFRCGRLRDRFRVRRGDATLGDFGRLAERVNELTPTRLRDLRFREDLGGVEFLSGKSKAAELDSRQLLDDLECVFDFNVSEVPGGKADGIFYWCSLDYGNGVVVDTWSEEDQCSSFKQAAFMFNEPKTVTSGCKGVFVYQSGLMELKLSS